ncbi:MAG: alpha/beta hydrolase [Desulfobacteraceae bacterium]|nr:alpha/beta hydrolase [Desulfobacteraceae bacterium]MBC2755686.1 alpha/beta hydrolase [Desulfobacteraceae bacterium]
MRDNEMALKAVHIGETSIPYLSYAGNGPTIVFLHATGFLPWLWHPIARQLKGSYRIIAPYYCDHRTTDPEKGGFNWLLLAQDLKNFCECLNITSPYMVGHSMGGAIMSIACGRFGLNVKKLLLIEPIFLPRELYNIQMRVEDHPLAGKSIHRRNFWKDTNEAKTYLKSKQLFQAWDDEMFDLYVEYGMMPSVDGGLELACHPRKEASLFMGSMGYDPWPVLPEVKCPVLVLEGEHTENKGFINQKKAVRAFPDGKYRLVKDVGHLIPMEKPKETALIIREFFEE